MKTYTLYVDGYEISRGEKLTAEDIKTYNNAGIVAKEENKTE